MSRKHSHPLFFLGLLTVALFILMLSACGGGGPTATGGKFRVLATTSIVGNVVSQVGGDTMALTILMPVGTDPHDFQPRPQDAAALADAQIIFSNGAGLEGFLQPLLESTGATGKLVEVSAGITLLPLPGSDQSTGDPHTWMDPNNVIIWTQNIAAALSAADPVHAADYQANAEAYATSLRDLDTWIRSEVAQILPQNRLLVADHAVLGYFAARYGFTQEGTITGSFSTEAAPSARELAALEDKIRQSGVRAVFVSEAVNQTLADQIAADTGIKSVWIYHATLTASGGPAASYLEFMRYNIKAIVEALK
ncbi:MAG: zinc ABC transporter substrate-binding protein [Candidatus Atribacteria bacterium]|nr:zinc ABC transporter substrate-binding protein [Candidatus Atribacteria bacterium]